MGQYRQDLGELLTLLGAGLDPMTGLSMYQQAQADKEERQATRQNYAGQMVRDVMPTIEQGGSYEQATASLGALADSYGVGNKAINKAEESLEGYFPNGTDQPSVYASMWDETDEGIVTKEVEALKGLNLGRDEIRAHLAEKYKSRLGDDVFREIAPMFRDAVNRNYGFPAGYTADDWRRAQQERATPDSPVPPAIQAPQPAPTPDPLGRLEIPTVIPHRPPADELGGLGLLGKLAEWAF